jgi:Zn-dependent peptidase ImmA (M78 family)
MDSPQAARDILSGYVQPWGVRTPTPSRVDYDRLDLCPNWEQAGARFAPERSLAAVVYRALSPIVTADDVYALLDRLRRYPSHCAAGKLLDDLRQSLSVSPRQSPHMQGYELAEQLREHLGNTENYFDVEALLQQLSVTVEGADLADADIGAATVWSDDHGPVVVLNTLGKRNFPWARRTTLSHELCHLLVDRGASAELMIASTPWAPPELERRANAFAAELLLPKLGMLRVVGDRLRHGWLDESARQELMDEFHVGTMVCEHQLSNRLDVGSRI